VKAPHLGSPVPFVSGQRNEGGNQLLVDRSGDLLTSRITDLAQLSIRHGRPIEFQ
jgi:hypothetical protein